MDDYNNINIAVAVAGIDEEYQCNIINGINKFAKENSVNVSYFAAYGGIQGSRKFDAGEYSIYKLIDFSKFDGAILLNNTIGDLNVRRKVTDDVIRAGIPCVVFDCDDFPEFINVAIDNDAAMRAIVRHVITEHGAKVINYISGPLENPEALARYKAFLEVMAENGLKAEDERVYFGEFRPQDGKRAVETFYESGQSVPDAVICANDAMALTAVSTIEKLGYRVPDDVIVTGFDCTYNAQNFSPALTTVKRPLFTAGYRAGRILLEIINGEEPDMPELEAFPVFSESCGCSTCSDSDFKEFKKHAYLKNEHTNMCISLVNRLTAALAESETSAEHFNAIDNFAAEFGCDKLCLCLAEDWEDQFNTNLSVEDDAAYPAYMTAPIIWDKGERRNVGYYPSSKMFPELLETGGNINYFLPLHFQDRPLGYYILTNGDFPISSLLCHTITMNISNSFENIRKLFHLNKTMEELNRLYVIDPLCNIYNRNGFIKQVSEKFKECVEKHITIMLSFIDMDGLKYINDNFGHNEGDFALQRLGSVINECCINDSVCARFGGDEFVMFSVGVTEDDGEALIRRFNKKLEAMNAIINKPYRLSASVGNIIEKVDGSKTLFNIIQQADDKMYAIKKERKMARTAGGAVSMAAKI